jgi:hypothetical protein
MAFHTSIGRDNQLVPRKPRGMRNPNSNARCDKVGRLRRILDEIVEIGSASGNRSFFSVWNATANKLSSPCDATAARYRVSRLATPRAMRRAIGTPTPGSGDRHREAGDVAAGTAA